MTDRQPEVSPPPLEAVDNQVDTNPSEGANEHIHDSLDRHSGAMRPGGATTKVELSAVRDIEALHDGEAILATRDSPVSTQKATPDERALAEMRGERLAAGDTDELMALNRAPDCGTHCGQCAVATDSWLAGGDAVAVRATPIERQSVEDLYGAPYQDASIQGIEDHLRAEGPGARVIIDCEWPRDENGNATGAHLFNACNVDGELRVIDIQAGTVHDNLEQYFDDAGCTEKELSSLGYIDTTDRLVR